MAIDKPLRRKDREITDCDAIDLILKRAEICRIGMVNGHIPYVIPMNYGYENGVLYFHTFKTGMKVDVIEHNNNVCVEVDIDTKLWPAKKICDWGFKYRSVIGFGKAIKIDNVDEKRAGLKIVIRQFTELDHKFSDEDLARVTVYKVPFDKITGKCTGYENPAVGL